MNSILKLFYLFSSNAKVEFIDGVWLSDFLYGEIWFRLKLILEVLLVKLFIRPLLEDSKLQSPFFLFGLTEFWRLLMEELEPQLAILWRWTNSLAGKSVLQKIYWNIWVSFVYNSKKTYKHYNFKKMKTSKYLP